MDYEKKKIKPGTSCSSLREKVSPPFSIFSPPDSPPAVILTAKPCHIRRRVPIHIIKSLVAPPPNDPVRRQENRYACSNDPRYSPENHDTSEYQNYCQRYYHRVIHPFPPAAACIFRLVRQFVICALTYSRVERFSDRVFPRIIR